MVAAALDGVHAHRRRAPRRGSRPDGTGADVRLLEPGTARRRLAYARKVLVNANIDRLRRRHITEVSDEGLERAYPARESSTDDRDELVRLLAGLTDRERRVLVLRHYYDLPENAVAGELGISIGTVKSTASRALAKLRSAEPAPAVARGVG